jgi:2'-5' RNA ligase
MRVFFAFTLPEKVRQKVFHNVSQLQKEIPYGVKWVEKENLHVTFRFLGNLDKAMLTGLDNSISGIVGGFPSFSLWFDDVKVIPNQKHPRLIWYQMREEGESAMKLFSECEKKLVDMGIEKADHPLSLHTTLGRVKKPVDVDWEKVLKQLNPIYDKVRCKELTLYKSELTKTGPIYSIVKRFPLKRGNQ